MESTLRARYIHYRNKNNFPPEFIYEALVSITNERMDYNQFMHNMNFGFDMNRFVMEMDSHFSVNTLYDKKGQFTKVVDDTIKI